LISEETDVVGWDYGVLASEVYDLGKPMGSSFGDVEYYREQLAGTEGPILEPAVGIGRILIPLLEAGFDVDGFDVSGDMLALCRRHCDERGLAPKLHRADMTTFMGPREYGAPAPSGTPARGTRRGSHASDGSWSKAQRQVSSERPVATVGTWGGG